MSLEIPGYAEAVAAERWNRDLAFLGYPIPLCGLMVNQFCPHHYILLEHGGNRFVCGGGEPRPEDVAMFLWVVSVDYQPGMAVRDAFIAAIAPRVSFAPACAEIAAYVGNALADAPAGGGPVGKSYTSWAASVVDMISGEYGWSYAEIMRSPFAVLFQLLRRIQKRRDPNAILINRSEQKISDWLQKRNASPAMPDTN